MICTLSFNVFRIHLHIFTPLAVTLLDFNVFACSAEYCNSWSLSHVCLYMYIYIYIFFFFFLFPLTQPSWKFFVCHKCVLSSLGDI